MKFTLLVIDDEKNIREGLAADFEMDGYDVKIAANGDEGLEFLSKGDIDLVITDLRMPGTSGEDVLKKVNRYYNTCKMQIIKSPQINLKEKVYVLAHMIYRALRVCCLGRF